MFWGKLFSFVYLSHGIDNRLALSLLPESVFGRGIELLQSGGLKKKEGDVTSTVACVCKPKPKPERRRGSAKDEAARREKQVAFFGGRRSRATRATTALCLRQWQVRKEIGVPAGTALQY